MTTTMQTPVEKGRFIKDKKFYRLLLIIALPITLQNIVLFLTQMLDTVMLGELGDIAISAASLGSQPFFIFNMLTFGLGSGAAVLTAQYWGKGEREPIRVIITMIIRITLVIGVLVTILTFIFPSEVMRIYTEDEAVIAAGARYLRIMCFSYPLFGFMNVYYTAMRSVESVKIALASNTVGLLTNACLNYILIFGHFGAPALGIEGAAIATLTARFVEFLIAASYQLFFDKKLKIKLSDYFTFNKLLFKDLIVISLPVVLNELMWALGTSMQAVLLGRISTTMVAANSIISVVQNLSTVAVFGIASAAAVMIGKSIGEGNMREACDRGHTFKILSVFIGFFVTAVILLLKNAAVDFYNVSEATKILAKNMMYVAAGIGFFVSISAVGIVGIMRGGGDTKFSLFSEMFALWGIAVPLAFTAAFLLHFPPVAVYLVMKLDEPVKSVFLLVRTRGTKWIRNVTR